MKQKEISVSDYNKSFWNKAIEITVITLAVLVPIAFHPRCYTTFAPAKEFTFEALVIIGLMFWAFKMASKEEIKFTSTPLNLPILSFIAICILSLIWSDTFFTSLKELPHFLAGPLLYFVIVNNIRDEKQISRIISAVLIVGAALGIYGIFQYNNISLPFWVPVSGRNKVFGLCGNVGYFAGYLILPLALAIPLFFVSKNRNRKILLLIGILAMGTTFIVTFTRSSYLALGVSLIFIFLLFLLSRGKNLLKENKKLFMIALIATIIAASLFIIPTPLNKSGTAISQIKSRISVAYFIQDRNITRRIAIWKCTWMMIKDHPILGSGIGTYKYNTLRYQAEFFEQGDNRSIYPYGFADKAHNEYLQLWAELGTIGLAIFLWLIIAYFIYGIRYLKREKDKQKQGIMIGLMGAVVAFLVDSFFWFPLHLSSNLSLFWLFTGLTIAMCIKGIEEKEKGRLEAEKIEKRIIGGGKDKKEKSDNTINIIKGKRSNIYRFKPVLYIVIVLLSVFLCATVFRPFMSRIIWYSGFKEIRNKNWEKVTDIYERALKWNPYEGYFHFDLGKVFLMRELGNTALKSFKEAEKYIDFPGLPQDIAIIYLAKGELDNAITELKKAISYQRKEETMPPLYIELGNVYLKLEKYEQAEIAFKNALKINSNILAQAYLEQNRTNEELEDLVKLKNRINSNLVNAHHRLAEAYLRQNKIEESLVELRKAISITYQNSEEKIPPLYVDLGNAYLKLGRYEPAEAAFKDALKIDPNLVSAHYGLSGVYLRQNKIEEGLIELKKVVELGPESEEAKYARDAIQKIEQAKLEAQPTKNNN